MTVDYNILASVISVIGTMALDNVINKNLAGRKEFWRCSLQAMVILEMITLYITTKLPYTPSLNIAELCMMSCTGNFDSKGLFFKLLLLSCYMRCETAISHRR